MKEIVSTITSKDQVTIPAEVRRSLGLKAKDKIAFVIESEGEVRLKVPRYGDIGSLRGKAGSLKRPLSWEEMRETAREDHLKPEHNSEG